MDDYEEQLKEVFEAHGATIFYLHLLGEAIRTNKELAPVAKKQLVDLQKRIREVLKIRPGQPALTLQYREEVS